MEKKRISGNYRLYFAEIDINSASASPGSEVRKLMTIVSKAGIKKASGRKYRGQYRRGK